MKNISTYFFLLCSIHLSAQRYLTPIFEQTIITQNIEYGSAINYKGELESLLLDFYEPEGDALTKRPLVIFAHGGGFVDVTQTKNLVHIEAYCDSLARRGYVVASIDYRLDESICNRAVVNAMHDMRAAIRFLKKEQFVYGVDTSVVVVTGESAGAITSLVTAYTNQDSEVLYPPTDPQSSDHSIEGNSGNPGFSSAPQGVMCLCGGTETALGEALFDTLSMNDKLDPPLFQIHGTADFFVPISKALDVSIRASNIELPFLFYPLQGANHCPWFFPLENSWAYLDTLIDLTVPFLFATTSLSTDVQESDYFDQEPSIYPNPSSGELNVTNLDDFTEALNVQILNIQGKLVFEETYINYLGALSLQVDFSQGLYVLKLRSKDKSYSKTFFVK